MSGSFYNIKKESLHYINNVKCILFCMMSINLEMFWTHILPCAIFQKEVPYCTEFFLMFLKKYSVVPLDPEFKDLGDLPALPCEYCTDLTLLKHYIRPAEGEQPFTTRHVHLFEKTCLHIAQVLISN